MRHFLLSNYQKITTKISQIHNFVVDISGYIVEFNLKHFYAQFTFV